VTKITWYIDEHEELPVVVEGVGTDGDGDPWPRAYIAPNPATKKLEWAIAESGDPASGRRASSLTEVVGLFGGGRLLAEALQKIDKQIFGTP
jgi:hypothetical protein